MGIVYGVLSQKGGVGKSTVSECLASAESENEERNVLLIDLDPQGHATEGIGLKEYWLRKDLPTLYEGMMSLKSINVMDLVHEVPNEKFFAIPSNFQMMELDKQLTTERSGETRLVDLISILRKAFDVIVIDSPSYFGNLTDNLLRSVGIQSEDGQLLLSRTREGQLTQLAIDQLSSGLIVPIQAEKTSVRAIEILSNQIDIVQLELKVKVNILAMVPNLVQESTLGRNVLNDFRTNLPDQMTIFDIPKRVVLQEAYDLGRSIFTYEPKDASKRKQVEEIRQKYRDLSTLLTKRSTAYVKRFN
jgi:chromosome partitioning protein